MDYHYKLTLTLLWPSTLVIVTSLLGLFVRGETPPDIFREDSLPFDLCAPEFRPMSEEQRLMRDLMAHYDPSVRPVYDAHAAVDVKLGLTLTQILDLDEKNQVLTTNVWLEASWYDERLNWTSSDYGGIESIRIPPDRIWLPDIVLYNSVDDYTSGYMPSLAMVYNDSRVFWGPVIRFRSACNIDITFFPFDNQICKLKMGSWAYNGLQVNVWNSSSTMDLSNFVDNGEWKLLAMQVKRNVVFYACCKEPFPDVTFTIILRRRTKYYFMNIIIPCIILSFLCLGGFLLPPESGEKITLGLSVLLTITVFMLMVADKMPQTSESISVISIYLMAVLSTSCMSVLSSVLVLSIHHQRERPKRVPGWLRWICFDLCGRVFRLKKTPLNSANSSSSSSSSSSTTNNNDDDFPTPHSRSRRGDATSSSSSAADEHRNHRQHNHHAPSSCRKPKPKPKSTTTTNATTNAKKRKRQISQYYGSSKKDKKIIMNMNNSRIGCCDDDDDDGNDDEDSEFMSLDPKVTFSNELENQHHQHPFQMSSSDSKDPNCKLYDHHAGEKFRNNSRYQRQNLHFESSSPNFSSYRQVDVDTSFVVSGKTNPNGVCQACFQPLITCSCGDTGHKSYTIDENVDFEASQKSNTTSTTTTTTSNSARAPGSTYFPTQQQQGVPKGQGRGHEQGSKVEGMMNILEDQSLLKGMTVSQRYNVIMVTQLASLIREKQSDDVKNEDIFQEWHNVAYILDRLLFTFFLVLTIVSTACILQMRPSEVEL